MVDNEKTAAAPSVLPDFMAAPASSKTASDLRYGDVVFQPHAVTAVALMATEVLVTFDDGTTKSYGLGDVVQIGP